MHLINITTLKLEEFIEGSIPEYAILSHRWSNDELTFKEVIKKKARRNKNGYKKLAKACEVAATYDVRYLWIDTCCIDKRSSAELSEAINSMFAWYQNAQVCIAYLEDVDMSMQRPLFHNLSAPSVWFTRSWTLQELIAPKNVDFYDKHWLYVSSKTDEVGPLSQITGIDPLVLSRERSLPECSIAERMSWAADRTATRSEDIAYSLMGMFDVNMALLYGEGVKAFGRLQEEIIRRTEDPTFLVWGYYDYELGEASTYRLLANSPKEFRKVPSERIERLVSKKTFGITNIGLEIDTEIIRVSLHTYGLLVGSTMPGGIASRREFMVLVRALPFSDAYCKLGVAIGWFYGAIERKKVVVLWDHEGQLDGSQHVAINRKVRYGFAVEAQLSRRSTVYTTHLEDGMVPISRSLVRDKLSASGESRTYSAIELDHPTHIKVLKLTMRIEAMLKFAALTIFLGFDFDSCPWAIICDGKLEPGISTILEKFRRIHTRSGTEDENGMIELRHAHDHAPIYAFRGHSKRNRSISARIPRVLLDDGINVLISFIPPHSYQSDASFWLFRISEAPRKSLINARLESQRMCELPGHSHHDKRRETTESAADERFTNGEVSALDSTACYELEGEPRFATYTTPAWSATQSYTVSYPPSIRSCTADGLRRAMASGMDIGI